MRVVTAPMREHPVGWRQRMRELSLGPVGWGVWSLTFADGSTYAAVAVDRGEILGWAVLTCEIDICPVVGVYVAPEHRGKGLGRLLVSSVLGYCLGECLDPGQEVYANSDRWPQYPAVVESCGLTFREWE